MSDIQVIDRMTALLDAVSRYQEPVSLKVLAAETSLHRSTAFRILDAMRVNGFIERDPNGRYQLGSKLLRLGNRVSAHNDIRKIALPFMEQLRDALSETVNLTVRQGDEVVYIEKATPNRMMHVQQLIGSRAPLHVTAVGKLMLAHGGDQECRDYALRTNLPAYTRNTVNRLPRLLEEAAVIRKTGYAFDNEEAEIGVGCIGTLIIDENKHVIAGLSISAPIERRQDQWKDHLLRTARLICDTLGYHHNPSFGENSL